MLLRVITAVFSLWYEEGGGFLVPIRVSQHYLPFPRQAPLHAIPSHCPLGRARRQFLRRRVLYAASCHHTVRRPRFVL